tara:strand:- start:402 stop:1031 length:630 start_codon:yes stop_codon:yes gene_type:complete
MSTEETKKKSNFRRRPRRSNPKNEQSQSSPQKTSNSRHRRKRHQKNNKNSKWNRHRISEHFMKRDFDSRKKDCTSCGSSLRISLGLVGIIEALRAQLNQRIEIVTGYYCPDCRDRQYGIKRDFHHIGVAADIRIENMSCEELFLIAETYPELKGIGINFDDNHVHIDTRKEDVRQTWVEINDEWIELTPDNRHDYIKTTRPDESCDTDS